MSRVRSAETIVAEAHLREGRPAEEIADLAKKIGGDLVVVDIRGLDMAKSLIVGSVSEGVGGLAPCPMLMVRGGEEAWPPREVLMGDGSSKEAREAGKIAEWLAGLYGSSAKLLRAYHPQPMVEATRMASHDPEAVNTALSAGEKELRERAAELAGILAEKPNARSGREVRRPRYGRRPRTAKRRRSSPSGAVARAPWSVSRSGASPPT